MKIAIAILALALPVQAGLIFLGGGNANELLIGATGSPSNSPDNVGQWAQGFEACDICPDLRFYAPASDGSLGDIETYLSPDPAPWGGDIEYSFVVFHAGQTLSMFEINSADQFDLTKGELEGVLNLSGYGGNVGGFSSAYYYVCTNRANVPDGGGTLALLGTSILGMWGIGRRWLR